MQPERSNPDGNRQTPTPPAGGAVPAFNLPPATLWTLLFLTGIFAGLRFGPIEWRIWMHENLAFSLRSFSQSLAQGLDFAELATLLTYGFVHVDPVHLILNVGFLAAFGSVVERRFGKSGFFFIFLTTIVCGALVEWLSVTDVRSVIIGASGGVSGLMGAVVCLMIASRHPPRRRNGFAFAAVFLAINFALGPLSHFWPILRAAIAWQAHIGGFVVGFLICWFWLRLQRHAAPGC